MLSITAGGINASDLVAGLMQVERQPLARIQDRQAAVRLQVTALTSITSDLATLRRQALSLIGSGFAKHAASSTSAAASATVNSAGTPATAGSISFTVDRVAQAHGLRTASSVATSSSPITSAAVLAVSTTTSPLGISSVRAVTGLGAGDFTVAVTQATRAAVRTGTSALATTTVVDASNDELQVEVNGVARSLTLAQGTYSAAQLATAVDSALQSAGGGASASVDAAGRLRIATTREGSAATLRVTGGDALADLRLAVDAAAVTGGDGTISVTPTGGTASTVTVSSASPGQSVTVPAGAGQLELTLDGGLRVGTSSVAVVSTGDGSLAAVASAINGAKAGVSAAAVRTGDGAWLLQLGASQLGTAGTIAIDAAAFTGGLVSTSTAQDAAITVGTGAGAYSITGRGSQFTDVLPGVTITATAVSSSPVTVSVAADHAATADAVESLIAKANTLIAQVGVQAGYDPDTGVAGPLNGERVVRQLAADVRAAISAIVPGSSTTLAGSVGISTNRDGSLKFDRAKFLTAITADPTGVARLFGRGGSSTGGAAFASATDATVAGTYAVNVTTAATRATTGVLAVAGNPVDDVIRVRRGTTTVSYTVAAGSSATDVADGLRTELATAGLGIDVLVEGGGIRLRAAAYGGAGTFDVDVASTGTGFQTSTGTDVVGTIDGKDAIGVGNTLRLLDTSTSTARGLEVTVDEAVTGALSVSYDPGIAARIVALDVRLTAENGSLTVTNRGLEARIEAFNGQVDRFEERMERVERNLIRQWSTIQTLLQSMESQSNWLTSQIAGLPKTEG